MHELSIAQSLVEQLDDVCRTEGRTYVRRLEIEVGSFSGVEADALELAFPVASEGTCAEGAECSIHLHEAEIECNTCRKKSTPDFPVVICGHCYGTDVKWIGGRELLLTRVELE